MKAAVQSILALHNITDKQGFFDRMEASAKTATPFADMSIQEQGAIREMYWVWEINQL